MVKQFAAILLAAFSFMASRGSDFDIFENRNEAT